MNAKDTLKMRQFPVVVASDCKNIRCIYPSKQRQVARIYDEAGRHDIIKKIIIFGSSVTSKCNVNSDLDICIDADISDGMKVYELQKRIGAVSDKADIVNESR